MTAASSLNALSQLEDALTVPNGPKLSVAAYGDSFVGPLFVLKKSTMHIKRFSGSTAKGLQNVNSASQTGPRLVQSLDSHMPDHAVLVFGHVDLHITYLYKALDSQLTSEKPPEPGAFVRSIFDAYTKFLLDEILPRRKGAGTSESCGYLQGIHIVSVVMPCVTDEHLDRSAQKYNQKSQEFRKLQGLRLADSACPTDLATRCKMVYDFNKMIKDFCRTHKLYYVDLNKHIAPEIGIVHKEYRDVDPSTIHVKWEPTIQFWVKELANTGLTMDDVDPNIDESLVEYELSKMDRMAKTRHRRFASVSEAAPPLSRIHHAPTPSISSAFTPSPVSVGDGGPWRRSHAHSVSASASPLKPSHESPGIYRPPHLAGATGLSGGEHGRRRGATLMSGPAKTDDRSCEDSWRVPGRSRAPSESIFGHTRHNSVATAGGGWGSRR
ncbi:unnamed protein product [Rhizoctonia solani]|uniref:Uncharacterized protein n=2 Tax=Rhizoctonia solani AG-3 TaxID=1086053 RepID=A0A074SSB5_9AGAM|nr:hypothetical protein RSOL_323620 [Rhizoctonia solani AG-3 Rhs1AP]KEP52857.1 hypothetical protein V565_038890 [Rhizoctonia solani 123E]CAE6446419.1 unnamed protein product [Rhizoctonia solani]